MQVKQSQSQSRQNRRRSRGPLSCDPCRSRKLKCNREKPCQNCAARDEQVICRYSGIPGEITRAQLGSASVIPQDAIANTKTSSTKDAHENAIGQRIKHLEDLVQTLIAKQQPTELRSNSISVRGSDQNSSPDINEASSPDREPSTGATGRLLLDGVHSVYVGGEDWHAVLQEINDLRTAWSHEQCSHVRPTQSHTVDGASLLFGHIKPLNKLEIVSDLPPRPEADQLIARFFDRRSLPISVPPIIHEPTFLREYERHWKDPWQTETIWLGLLFSMLGIVMLAYHQYGEPAEYRGRSESLFQVYRTRTAQCLIGGDMAKCLPYTLETLRFNATAELNRKDDNRRGLWIMTGVIMRVAINMGYHRDPKDSPGISAMQAEYRRRVWSSVVSMDDMASFNVGFPRAMKDIYSDTLEPRNLHEWVLSENGGLPSSRPLTETTAVTYLIVKTRMLKAVGRVADFTSDPRLGTFETALEIDQDLRNTYESVPPSMQLSPSVTDPMGKPIALTDNRANFTSLSLAAMYHRAMCRLHRKFLAKGRKDSRTKLSHHRCISSAMALLGFQEWLDPSLYRLSETRQMLMLAAMILFLELALRRQYSDGEDDSAELDSAVLLQALERSNALFARAESSLDEVRRAQHVLASMLSHFRTGDDIATTSTAGWRQGHAKEEATPERTDGLNSDAMAGSVSFEQFWTDSDFDWVSWDTFIDESGLQAEPMY